MTEVSQVKNLCAFFFILIIFQFIFLSCEINEPEASTLKKSEIVYDIKYDDITGLPQRIIRNSNNDIFLYSWQDIVKIDKNGNKIWAIKQNNGDLAPTKDGGCIVFDIICGSNSYDCSTFLIKINSEGNVEWKKDGGKFQLAKIVLGDNEEIYGISDCELSNYFRKPKFVKYTKDGDFISSYTLITKDDKRDYQTLCAKKIRNNRLVIGTLNTVSEERLNYDYNIIEFDIDSPTTIYEYNYGGYKNDYLRNIYETVDGGLVLMGYSESKDGDIKSYREELPLGANGWVVKLDNKRDISWEKILGGTGSTYFYKTTYFDNNYLVGFQSTAIDCDFNSAENTKSGFIVFDDTGNILDISYIEAYCVDCEFNSEGELLLLSTYGDDYYQIYHPRLLKIK